MISSIVTLLFLSSAHGISLVKIPPDINPMYKYVELQPRHVHLSLGRLPNSLVWTWSTRDPTPHPTLLLTLVGQEQQEVAYNGTSSVQEVAYNGTSRDQEVAYNGTSRIFVDGGNERRSQWIHRVEVTGLQANAKYSYIVGSSLGWSDVFHTTTAPKGNNWSLRLALYGDLGNENAISLPMIQREVDDGKYDGILHVGDFAYDMDSDNARTGDAFMEQIEPIASLVPYMTCPGNHEWRYNFSNYKARFNMPRDGSNMYYSFNMGPVHFVSVSTEFYYYINYGIKMLINQYHWLQQDLAKANTPEARANQPWIVIFGHRPMYCSTTDEDDCDSRQARTRVGMPVLHWWGMEDIMYKHGVDLAVWAHEHNYERLWPTYDMKVLNGTAGPYVDPPAPVHVTTGSPGCKERHDNFQPVAPEWTAFRSKDYGYTRLYVHNATHVNIQQVSADQGGKVIDDFWILKNKHGSYN